MSVSRGSAGRASCAWTRSAGSRPNRLPALAPEMTRTSDLRFRKPPLYPPELRGRDHRNATDTSRGRTGSRGALRRVAYRTSESTGASVKRPRPPRTSISARKRYPATSPPARRTRRPVAAAVPPVASTSSTIQATGPAPRSRRRASRASPRRTRGRTLRRSSPTGSFPGLRTQDRAAARAAARFLRRRRIRAPRPPRCGSPVAPAGNRPDRRRWPLGTSSGMQEERAHVAKQDSGLAGNRGCCGSRLRTRAAEISCSWGSSLRRREEWSGREDSNLRPPSPEPGALPAALRPDPTETSLRNLSPELAI